MSIIEGAYEIEEHMKSIYYESIMKRIYKEGI
jgi:hypothetical protein